MKAHFGAAEAHLGAEEALPGVMIFLIFDP
jgi:hypothetical protein